MGTPDEAVLGGLVLAHWLPGIARTGTIDEQYPEPAPLLATPCNFVIYRKDLTIDPVGAEKGDE